VQTSAADEGAGGGFLGFLFDTEPAWISASAILQAIADGLFADALTKEDAVQHGAMQYGALQSLQPGGSAQWLNEQTGHGGSTAVSDAFEMSDGTVCKAFTERIVTAKAPILRDGLACKAPGGDWEVRVAV
jgi:surface antigen